MLYRVPEFIPTRSGPRHLGLCPSRQLLSPSGRGLFILSPVEGPRPAPSRHSERSRPTLFLSASLPRSGRPAQRGISLLFDSPRFHSVWPALRICICSGDGIYLDSVGTSPSWSLPLSPAALAVGAGLVYPEPSRRAPPSPIPSFRTEQADALSFRFAPAKRSAYAERNLSSLCFHRVASFSICDSSRAPGPQ